MTSPAARRLPGLDGLRAVAVGIVMVAHGNSSLPMRGAWTRDFWLFFDNGPLGVMIFFVLSGFLITYLLKQEINRTGKIHLGLFYQRRVLRIFPAFYFFLGCVFVLNLLGWLKIKWADFIFAGTFTWNYRIFGHGWNPGHFDNTYDPWAWYLWHTWTLSLEEQFYLLWPAALLLLGLKRGAVAALGILLLEPVLRLAAYLWLPSLRTVSPGMLPFALDPLMAGSLAALWSGEPWFESMVNRVLKKSWLVAGAILFRVFISPILILKFRGGYQLLLAPTLESLAILIVMLWLLRREKTWLGRLFNSGLMVRMGILSYSLYLWQEPFLVTRPAGAWIGQYFPLNYICCLGAALFSYHLIEKPFLRLKDRNRFSQQRLEGAAAAQPGAGNPAALSP